MFEVNKDQLIEVNKDLLVEVNKGQLTRVKIFVGCSKQLLDVNKVVVDRNE